jgi:hypothetical protein
LFVISNKANFPQSFEIGKHRDIITNLNLTSFINNQSLEWDLEEEFLNAHIGKHTQGTQYNMSAFEFCSSSRFTDFIRADNMALDLSVKMFMPKRIPE